MAELKTFGRYKETEDEICADIKDVEASLESLSDERLFKMVVMLPIVFPSVMMPVRLPELYYKMKNKLYPDYLYYAMVALGRAATLFSVKVSRIYQLDLSKIKNKMYSEEELEFRRRVFWAFYSSDRGTTSFNGSFPIVQDLDIVVNLPINDFWWRYGGECEVEHPEIIFWNHIANSENNEQYSKGDTKNFVKTTTLLGKVSVFAKQRWIKKVYNPDDDNCQLVRLIDKLNKFEETVVKNPPIDFNLIKETYPKYKDTIRFTVDMEHILYKRTFTEYHFYMKSVLYQTEMVRVEGIHMHPGRIVSAKNICVDIANKQIDLICKLSEFLPLEYWENSTIATGLMSAVTCLNYISVSPKNDSLDISSKMKNLKEVYRKLSDYHEISAILLMYLDRLSKFIKETHKENKKYKQLYKNMKKYSIDDSDVHPWIVSKYGLLFLIQCCFEGSFTNTKLTDYLYIKNLNDLYVDEHQETSSSDFDDKKSTRNSNIFPDQIEELPGIVSPSRNKSHKSLYKTNYDQYIKYGKLLEETDPNAVDNYYYQYMVDFLSEKVVQDIINNPVNNRTNFET
ncbi:hypothetical protein BB559_001210 [Furculomyces boomerangus]|uniref:Xylanolytic transcriptional activator regulatory domain-containing protein n=1 Tax=Furculomyces boomerangus TaxID=61424 RepID=A0A2T9Z2N5_9FUNG|nr:hypothetical protein BB559_001210 [Furculomyces boomerangus]